MGFGVVRSGFWGWGACRWVVSGRGCSLVSGCCWRLWVFDVLWIVLFVVGGFGWSGVVRAVLFLGRFDKVDLNMRFLNILLLLNRKMFRFSLDIYVSIVRKNSSF